MIKKDKKGSGLSKIVSLETNIQKEEEQFIKNQKLIHQLKIKQNINKKDISKMSDLS